MLPVRRTGLTSIGVSVLLAGNGPAGASAADIEGWSSEQVGADRTRADVHTAYITHTTYLCETMVLNAWMTVSGLRLRSVLSAPVFRLVRQPYSTTVSYAAGRYECAPAWTPVHQPVPPFVACARSPE